MRSLGRRSRGARTAPAIAQHARIGLLATRDDLQWTLAVCDRNKLRSSPHKTVGARSRTAALLNFCRTCPRGSLGEPALVSVFARLYEANHVREACQVLLDHVKVPDLTLLLAHKIYPRLLHYDSYENLVRNVLQVYIPAGHSIEADQQMHAAAQVAVCLTKCSSVDDVSVRTMSTIGVSARDVFSNPSLAPIRPCVLAKWLCLGHLKCLERIPELLQTPFALADLLRALVSAPASVKTATLASLKVIVKQSQLRVNCADIDALSCLISSGKDLTAARRIAQTVASKTNSVLVLPLLLTQAVELRQNITATYFVKLAKGQHCSKLLALALLSTIYARPSTCGSPGVCAVDATRSDVNLCLRVLKYIPQDQLDSVLELVCQGLANHTLYKHNLWRFLRALQISPAVNQVPIQAGNILAHLASKNATTLQCVDFVSLTKLPVISRLVYLGAVCGSLNRTPQLVDGAVSSSIISSLSALLEYTDQSLDFNLDHRHVTQTLRFCLQHQQFDLAAALVFRLKHVPPCAVHEFLLVASRFAPKVAIHLYRWLETTGKMVISPHVLRRMIAELSQNSTLPDHISKGVVQALICTLRKQGQCVGAPTAAAFVNSLIKRALLRHHGSRERLAWALRMAFSEGVDADTLKSWSDQLIHLKAKGLGYWGNR